MTTKSGRRRKAKTPVVCVAQTTGTAAPPAATAPPTATEFAEAERIIKDISKGVERLTSPMADFHRTLGKQTLQLTAMVAPKVIAAVRAARRAWRKPDAEAKRRAKALAKRWGV